MRLPDRGTPLNQLKWGVLLSYLSTGLGVLVTLVYTPLMLRLLGQSEWGLYSLAASVIGYLPLLSFGFGAAYVRYHTRAISNGREGEVARLNGLFLMVFLAMSAVAVLVGVILTLNVGAILGDKLTPAEVATARVLMGAMTFTVAVSFPSSVFNSFITANERFFYQRLLGVIKMVGLPALTLVVLLAGYKSVGMAVVASAVAVAALTADITYCVKRLGMSFSFGGLDLSLLREIAVFSSYIFINLLVDQVNWNVDKFLLGRSAGTVAVAVYALAAQFNAMYMSLSTAVSSVFIPRVNRLVVAASDDNEITALFTRVGRVQFLVLALVCGGLIVFGESFINVWAGTDYGSAYPIVLVLVIPVTVPLIQNLGIEIQRAKNLHQFRSWLYLGIAVLNVMVSIPLVRLYGGVGAALGTAGALLLGNGLIMNVYYHRRVGIDMKYFWRQIGGFLPALAVVALAGAAIMIFADTSLVTGMLFWGLVYLGVYITSMWFLGMDDFERGLIRRPIRQLVCAPKATVR